MHCKNPYTTQGMAFGCGQCLPCRINKRRVWTHRIMLEAAQYENNSFVTLTFSDDNLPSNSSVTPRDLSLFIKRLRFNTGLKIRYFGVGEYGDQTGRPHYHLALFGYPSCPWGVTRRNRKNCCPTCDTISKAWPFGRIEVGTLEQKSAAYIAGYVVKKYTKDCEALEGRLPEFARMSLRPGIGLGMMHDIASVLLTHKIDDKYIDVPLTLQHGKNKWPLGRYLRRKLRTFVGKDEKAPPEIIEKIKEELRPLRESAYANARPGIKEFTFKGAVIDAGAQKRANLEAKDKIFRARKTQI